MSTGDSPPSWPSGRATSWRGGAAALRLQRSCGLRIGELLDPITEQRTPGRAIMHPRYRRPAQFLFTVQGRRLGQGAVRAELRHPYANAMVNAGVSLQALMALLGHLPAEIATLVEELAERVRNQGEQIRRLT